MTLPATPNVFSASAQRLPELLPSLEWITDPLRVGRLSQDFAWFSPVLKRQLTGKRADVVVRPRTEDEVRQVVALARASAFPSPCAAAAPATTVRPCH